MQIDSKYVNSFLNIFLYDIRLCHETKNVQDLHDSFASPQNRWCMLIAGCSMEGKDWMLSLVSGNVKGGRQGLTEKSGGRVYRKNSRMGGLTFRSLMSRVSDRGRKRCPGRSGWKKYVLRFWRRGGNWRSYARARERGSEGERQVRKLFITPSFRANSRMLRAETRHRSSFLCNFSWRDRW